MTLPNRIMGFPSGSVAIAIALIATTGWLSWLTVALRDRPDIVQVSLQPLIDQNLSALAKSELPPGQAQARMEAVLNALDQEVRALGQQGKVVIISQAIVAGDVPDMTAAINASVATKLQTIGKGDGHASLTATSQTSSYADRLNTLLGNQ